MAMTISNHQFYQKSQNTKNCERFKLLTALISMFDIETNLKLELKQQRHNQILNIKINSYFKKLESL